MTTRPSLRESDFERVRQLRLDRLRQLKDLPPAVAERAFLRLMYGSIRTAIWRSATTRRCDALSLDDVSALHAAMFRPSRATLVMTGALSHQEMIEIANVAFGEWADESGTRIPVQRASAIEHVAAKGGTHEVVACRHVGVFVSGHDGDLSRSAGLGHVAGHEQLGPPHTDHRHDREGGVDPVGGAAPSRNRRRHSCVAPLPRTRQVARLARTKRATTAGRRAPQAARPASRGPARSPAWAGSKRQNASCTTRPTGNTRPSGARRSWASRLARVRAPSRAAAGDRISHAPRVPMVVPAATARVTAARARQTGDDERGHVGVPPRRLAVRAPSRPGPRVRCGPHAGRRRRRTTRPGAAQRRGCRELRPARRRPDPAAAFRASTAGR